MLRGEEILEGELACEEEDRMEWVVKGKNVYASSIDIARVCKIVA